MDRPKKRLCAGDCGSDLEAGSFVVTSCSHAFCTTCAQTHLASQSTDSMRCPVLHCQSTGITAQRTQMEPYSPHRLLGYSSDQMLLALQHGLRFNASTEAFSAKRVHDTHSKELSVLQEQISEHQSTIQQLTQTLAEQRRKQCAQTEESESTIQQLTQTLTEQRRKQRTHMKESKKVWPLRQTLNAQMTTLRQVA